MSGNFFNGQNPSDEWLAALFGGRQAGRSDGNGNGGARPPRHPSLPEFKIGRPGPLAITLIVLVALVAVLLFASRYWTEILWFNQTGYQRVIWTEWGSKAALFIFGLVVVTLLLMLNMRIAYHNRMKIDASSVSAARYRESVERWGKVLGIGLPIVLGIISGLNLLPYWRTVLMALFGKSFGENDALFGIDISFFTFRLPLIDLLLSFVVGVMFLATLVALVMYYVFGAIQISPRLRVLRPARIHLGILLAVLSLLVGFRYFLDRFTLVYATNTPTDGAMYTDVHAVMNSKLILAVIALLIAALFIFAAFRGAWYLPVAGIGVMLISALIIGVGYPYVIQRFQVDPNERALESPYIQRNIDATLTAYGLDDLEYQNYTAETKASAGQLRNDSESTSQIRLLDPEIVSPTVKQMQQSRPYYTFPDQLAVDRYTLEDTDGREEKRDTVIAVREINLAGLSAGQQNWVNRHTVYTHGFGVVAAYGNKQTSNGLPAYWEQSIPSTGEMGEYEPRVYFSQNSPSYSIVGGDAKSGGNELDYPDDTKASGQVNYTFQGDGGPNVGNVWNKLLYAIKFQSTDLFFSNQINPKSQILYDRDPKLRVAKVAPYLTLDNKVYPAVVDSDGNPKTPKRLVWIVDAYTTSDAYPYSQHVDLTAATADSRTTGGYNFFTAQNVNYMRNSVKAVVDAYDGSVTLYEWDTKDPVLKTWQSVYPGQVKPLSEISGDLMGHLRYPEDLFKVQRSLLANYHVTDAAQFYTGGDQWKLSEDPTAAGDVTGQTTALQPPYYLTMQMPDQESAEFSLTSVFIPGGESKRAAMAGFLAVDSETGNEPGKVRADYGKLRLIALPSSTTVPGPGQVQNSFNSNATVNKELNLQDQQGSKVLRGNLLTLPVGGGLLYVQPVYVQSTGTTSYPQLRSVLVAFGDQVGFAPTLEEALNQVFGGDSAAQTDEMADSGQKSGASGLSKSASKAAAKSGSSAAAANAALTYALARAQKAIADSDSAMKAGDWAAYGEAQKALDKAIADALAAQ